MSFTRYRRASPMSSSSQEDMLTDAFFAPEYPPTDIKTWRSGLKPAVPMYFQGVDMSPLPPLQHDFVFDANPLYHPHGVPQESDTVHPTMSRHVSSIRPGKRSSEDSSGSEFAASSVVEDYAAEHPPSKRSRKDPPPNGRVTGACTRCKRLKMKCTFADGDTICARCIVGGHECIVLGRKPRSPGMREILRKQIREKDAMIDTLLAQLNPAAPAATPLSLNVSKLALTPEQRNSYRDVLVYFEKAQGVRNGEKGKIDVSTLDDDYEFESDSDGDADPDVDDLSGSIHQLHLPTKCTPAGLVAKTALETRTRSRLSSPTASVQGRSESDAEDGAVADAPGIGNLSYFEPGPSSNLDLRRLIIERQAAPEILLSGLITNEDVGKLFQIFWKWINPIVPVLDENIHTPAAVLGRCPFLFTVVCALASRYYEEKPHIYTLAIHIAKAAAANAFLDGWKTVEMCQAYVLMATYMPPARRWDEDRSWFYSGIAFRLAVDLDLGRPPAVRPADERGEREVLNRLRAYVICYIVDRCLGINLGKSFMVPENELIRNANSLFLGSAFQGKCDPFMVSLVELYHIMSRFVELANPAMESRSESLSETDLIAMHKVTAEELAAWETTALARCAADDISKEPEDRIRMGLLVSCYQYCRLVTFSSGLHQVMKMNKLQEDKIFFAGCLHAGSAVVNCVIERILPTGFLRFSPEHVFALSAFGTAMLMKFLRPEFAKKLGNVQEERILTLLQRLLQSLDRDQIDTDDQSIPRRCYAKFLRQVLTSRSKERQNRVAAENSQCSLQTPEQVPVASPSSVDDVKPTDFMSATQDLSFMTQWDAMNPGNVPTNANADTLLTFNESEYMQTFMAFPDQAWFMQ